MDRRYQVVRTLGQGGFGRTYLVKDKKSFDNFCVLKEFVPQATDEQVINKSRELFEREAKVLNHLGHKQIPKFFGWFEEKSKLFLVQQFVDGETYAQLLQKRRQDNQTFSEAEVTQLLKDLLPVLQYVHTNNIIHRDISPDNIMRCRQADKPILIDFGVVNQRTATQVASGAVSAGTTVGKQSYSPVEQIGRGICYPSSDLYALGVTAMVLLTGKQPNEFFDPLEDRWQWRSHTQVSDSLAQIIDKMSADHHRDRYQSAQEVLNEFKVPPIPPTVIEDDSSSKKSRVPLLATIGVGAIAIVGGLFFAVTPNVRAICTNLNNCSSEIEFEQEYESIVKESKPLITEAANDENLATYKMSELQDLQQQLEQFANKLEVIPDNLKIGDRVEQTSKEIDAQIDRIETAKTPNFEKPGSMFIKPK